MGLIDRGTFMSTGKTPRTLLSIALTGAGSLAVTMVAPSCAEHVGLGLNTRAIARHARLHAEGLGSASTGAAGLR